MIRGHTHAFYLEPAMIEGYYTTPSRHNLNGPRGTLPNRAMFRTYIKINYLIIVLDAPKQLVLPAVRHQLG